MSCEAGFQFNQNVLGYSNNICSTTAAPTGQLFPGWFMLELNPHEATLAVAFSGRWFGSKSIEFWWLCKERLRPRNTRMHTSYLLPHASLHHLRTLSTRKPPLEEAPGPGESRIRTQNKPLSCRNHPVPGIMLLAIENRPILYLGLV